MNINVGPKSRGKFWDVPADPGALEYMDFSFQPPCAVGDGLVFRFDGVAVARAVVERIGQVPATGTFGRDGWRVYWKVATFEDLRTKPAGERPANTARETNRTGGLFGNAGGRLT